jgi:hypothetical protein
VKVNECQVPGTLTFVNANQQNVADRAEGLVDLGR